MRDFLHTDRMEEEEVERAEFWVLANRVVRQSGEFNFKGVKIEVKYGLGFGTTEQLVRRV